MDPKAGKRICEEIRSERGQLSPADLEVALIPDAGVCRFCVLQAVELRQEGCCAPARHRCIRLCVLQAAVRSALAARCVVVDGGRCSSAQPSASCRCATMGLGLCVAVVSQLRGKHIAFGSYIRCRQSCHVDRGRQCCASESSPVLWTGTWRPYQDTGGLMLLLAVLEAITGTVRRCA